MAKKGADGIVLTGVQDIAETAPVEKPVTVSRVTTEAQAKELLKNYKIPEGCKVAFVSEDRNVFWQENQRSAVNHTQKNDLKLFRIDVAQ